MLQEIKNNTKSFIYDDVAFHVIKLNQNYQDKPKYIVVQEDAHEITTGYSDLIYSDMDLLEKYNINYGD